MSLTPTQRAGYLEADEAPVPHSQPAAGLLLPGVSGFRHIGQKGGGGAEKRQQGRPAQEARPPQELNCEDKLDPLLARFIDECIVPLVVKVLREEEGF